MPRTLAGRLVLTSVLLVAVVSVLVGTVTTAAMRGYLTGQLDAELRETLARATGPQSSAPPPAFGHEPMGEIRGQRVGTLTVRFGDCGDSGEVITSDRPGRTSVDDLPASVVEELGLRESSNEPETLTISGYGSYRVLGDSDCTLVGLPTEDVDEAVGSLVRWEIALGGIAILLAAIAGNVVVRRQLRPLSEVAATAHTVAELPLGSGDIGDIARVPDRLADDRSEVGQVGAALNTLLAHVETSLAARHRSEQQVRQFVADASHELRTPLTTIAGYTELAQRRGDPATTATALTKVGEEAGRMRALVEDLLLLARLDAGRPLAREKVDLSRLLVEAVDDARVVAPEHRWRVALPDGDEPVEVTGDADRLHQVVTNLLTNARKHTPAGTTVTVTAREGGFDVHDDGPGFPADLVDAAFERFSRGDASRHRDGGAGLGLALVDAIVGAHDGTVTLTSAPGDTTLRVRLPGPSPTNRAPTGAP